MQLKKEKLAHLKIKLVTIVDIQRQGGKQLDEILFHAFEIPCKYPRVHCQLH